MKKNIHVRVPATTANMGPGFDSIGMALSIYNDIYVEDSNEKLVIESINKNIIVPTDNKNLIYSTITHFYNILGIGQVPNIKLLQDDNIPLTRGLGSSAACIVSGLLIANEISKSNLSKDDIATIAAKIEGHPDNSTPALMGGLVVGAFSDDKLEYVKIKVKDIEKLKFTVMIPDFLVATEKARSILPSYYKKEDVVFNISHTALMISAFITGDFERLMSAMDDKIHQPYRKDIIENMENIFDISKKNGAKAVFLSGAGPAIIAISTENTFVGNMQSDLINLKGNWKTLNVSPDLLGAQIYNNY